MDCIKAGLETVPTATVLWFIPFRLRPQLLEAYLLQLVLGARWVESDAPGRDAMARTKKDFGPAALQHRPVIESGAGIT